MLLEPPAPLNGWQDFYVIMGSSAAALTGLNFVVVALSAERSPGTPAAFRAFATPTIVHFGAVLLVAAFVTAPWAARYAPSWALGTAGIVGLLYTANVVRHTLRQKVYTPVAEDWIWHIILPVASYALLTIGGLGVRTGEAWTMLLVGAAAVTLTFVGIHNAWDSATYLATRRGRSASPSEPAVTSTPGDGA